VLTAVYLAAIQYYTRIGGKVSVTLIKYENNQGEQSSADSLVYKVNTMMPRIWFTLYVRFLTLLANAGLWSLLYAIIYWIVLPCFTAPQHYGTPASPNQASHCVPGMSQL
jgi:hypothetical protein